MSFESSSEGAWLARSDVRPGAPGWFRRGRWLVHRERCRLEAGTPAPPFREADGLSVGLRRVLRGLGLQSAAVQALLLAEWAELVGAEVARHTRPGGVRNRELTVFVRGAVWYAQLKRAGQAELQARIVRRLGHATVNRVTLRPDPEGGAPA